MSKLCIGLTGNIGSGKSTVAKMFAALGIDIIDADDIARQVVAPGSQTLDTIKKHFGHEIIDEDGKLNRSLLRKIIFNDEQQKTWLENLLHPLIREEIVKQVTQSTSPYCIVEIPLLYDRKSFPYLDRVLTVSVDRATQIQRLKARDGNDEETLKKIINAQPSNEERLKLSDDIIDNSQDLEALSAKVNKLHHIYSNK